jgi:transposase-like protein
MMWSLDYSSIAMSLAFRSHAESTGLKHLRGVKRVTRPMLGFKSSKAAQGALAGVEFMHMIKKRQMVLEAGEEGLSAAEQFYALASSSPL